MNEVKMLLGRATSDAGIQQIEKINQEINLLDSVTLDYNTVQGPLNTASTLAAIRDVMVDKRDKTILELYLSESAVYAKNHAELSFNATNRTLTVMSRPGIAVDVSRLRDAMGMVLKELQKCESPRIRGSR